MNNNSHWKVLLGTIVDNKYVLKRVLGAGAFGVVFLADEIVGNNFIRQVAVKIIISAPDGSQAQLNELITATKVKHPNLLTYITGNELRLADSNLLYLVMELADTSLDKELKTRKFSDSEIQNLIKDIAAGLAHLHQHSIVHRDLKPANIVCVGSTWKIADFGLVKKLETSTHQTGGESGTYLYMPPEALEGKVNCAWDLWSLGVLILEILTGKFPYTFNNLVELIINIKNKEPQIPTLRSPWQKIVKGCLTKDYKNRWKANDVVSALTPKSSSSISLKSLSIWGSISLCAIAGITIVRNIDKERTPEKLVSKCNTKTNRIFFRRHPEFENKAIPFYDLDAAQEWVDIRNSFPECSQISISKSRKTCDKKTDLIFYYRYPELAGKLINKNNKNLAQEWKNIRNRIPGCSYHRG